MIFDGHSDILTNVTVRKQNGEKKIFQTHHYPDFQKGNIDSGILVIWIDPPHDQHPQKRAGEIVTSLQEMLVEESEILYQVKRFADFEKAKQENKIAIMVGMEGMSHIGQDTGRLEYFYHQVGARHGSLTWNEENELATGVAGNPDRGLTYCGRLAVRKMEEMGMLVDVSHLNEKSFWDVAEVATKPFVASHSNAYALSPVSRNLKDEQIREIASRNGVIGMNCFRGFVHPEKEKQNLIHFVDHVDYIADLVGIETIGLGFDFCEYIDPSVMGSFSVDAFNPNAEGLDTRNGVDVLEELDKRGYKSKDIELICKENFHRILKEVIK